jgi:hypothetical protein
MRILSSVVEVLACPMPDIGLNRTPSNAVAPQAIGDEAPPLVLHPVAQALEHSLCGRAVPTVLHQNLHHDTALIRRAP